MTARHLPIAIATALFVAGYAVCCILFPAFLSTRVAANLLTDNAFLGIAAVGMTFVIISGGIDLSVGSVIGFTTVLIASAITSWNVPPLVAFLIVLTMTTAFGAVMGAAIEFLELPPFIVTLAGMFVARGASLLLSTEPLPISPPLYAAIDDAAILLPGGGRLTIIAIVMIVVFMLGGIALHATRFGLTVFALGGSRISTALMAVRVRRNVTAIYALSSGLAGLAGIVFSLYTASGNPLAATGAELDAIAAVIIGGTLLTGGYGSMIGTFLGVMLQGLISSYITFDGTLSSWWAKIATGLLLFAFIALQQATLAAVSRSRRAKPTTRPIA